MENGPIDLAVYLSDNHIAFYCAQPDHQRLASLSSNIVTHRNSCSTDGICCSSGNSQKFRGLDTEVVSRSQTRDARRKTLGEKS